MNSLTWANRRLGTSGVALPEVTLRLIDPVTLEQVPLGQEGEVYVSRTC